jgi:rare lipoprotein A
MRTARLPTLAMLAVAALLTPGKGASGQSPEAGVVFREEGEASYYGPGFHGKPTASGEAFDQEAMTAAHRKLPLGAEVTVTDPATGRQVEVEVNDRGPYADGRDLDLSQGAARKLGITREGVAEVTIEATKGQVEEAVDGPSDVPKVEERLEDARRAAAAEGTAQPRPLPPLEQPPGR